MDGLHVSGIEKSLLATSVDAEEATDVVSLWSSLVTGDGGLEMCVDEEARSDGVEFDIGSEGPAT